MHGWGSFGGDRVERVGKSIDEEVGKDQDYVTEASRSVSKSFRYVAFSLRSRLISSEVSARSFPAAGVMGLRETLLVICRNEFICNPTYTHNKKKRTRCRIV